VKPSAGHSVKPPKAKPKVQTQRSMPIYSLLKITAKILSMINDLMKKKFGLSTEIWVEHFAREAELLAP
jgi:hypothetical protein